MNISPRKEMVSTRTKMHPNNDEENGHAEVTQGKAILLVLRISKRTRNVIIMILFVIVGSDILHNKG